MMSIPVGRVAAPLKNKRKNDEENQLANEVERRRQPLHHYLAGSSHFGLFTANKSAILGNFKASTVLKFADSCNTNINLNREFALKCYSQLQALRPLPFRPPILHGHHSSPTDALPTRHLVKAVET